MLSSEICDKIQENHEQSVRLATECSHNVRSPRYHTKNYESKNSEFRGQLTMARRVITQLLKLVRKICLRNVNDLNTPKTE